MEIRLTIFEYASKKNKGNEPIKKEYKGAWALETMIADILLEYYGARVKDKVMDFLRERIKKEEE
jgi:hypothetical protein